MPRHCSSIASSTASCRLSVAVVAAASVAVDVLRNAALAPLVVPPLLSVLVAGGVVAVPGGLCGRRRPSTVLLLTLLPALVWQVVASAAAATADAAQRPPALAIAAFAFAAAMAALAVVAALARRWPRVGALLPWIPTAVVAGWLACGELTVGVAMAPRPAAPPDADALLAGEQVEEVVAHTADGLRIDAWLVRRDPRRCVLLLAGIGGNRRMLAARSRYWLTRGHSVLLPDLRATGTSGGDVVAFGWHERQDVAALWELLAERGFDALGVHAQSLGAAAFCYALRDGLPSAPGFVVLEGMYDALPRALAQRLPWIPLPEVLLWPVVACGEHRLRAPIDRLRPIDALCALRAPTLIVQGDADLTVGLDVPPRLASSIACDDVEVLWLPGHGHVDLWPAAEPAYRAALDAFLERLR